MYNPKQPFDLMTLPPPISLKTHPNIDSLFAKANQAQIAISELKGLLSNINNPDILLNSLYLQESVSSNAVENIHTTIESALEDGTKPEKERSHANKEVLNYRDALLKGHESLKQYGLSSRTIKTIHKNLKVNRGVPGEFRQHQNTITNELPDGTKEVIYTPPIAANIGRLLSNLETFAERNKDFIPLIKAAISHYQFEAIHPFEDGNGRTGRILMVLELVQDELLPYPALFISGYLSKHDREYKKLLLEVTTKKKWWDFIEFMLVGFTYQALSTQIALNQLNIGRLELMVQLHANKQSPIKKANIETVINHIFQNPTTQAKFMAGRTGIHWQTCTKYLNHLSEIKILRLEKRGRYKFYSNELAIKSLNEKTKQKKLPSKSPEKN